MGKRRDQRFFLTLLYACETWSVYSRQARQLNFFHMPCLRKLLRIRWQDKVPNTEVLQRANMESIHAFLKRFQLKWPGHVLRMPDERLPKRLPFGELVEGKRSLGSQKKRCKDTLKASLKHCNIDPDTWKEIARNQTFWCSTVFTGVSSFEAKRVEEQEQKRQLRKIKVSTVSYFSVSLSTLLKAV